MVICGATCIAVATGTGRPSVSQAAIEHVDHVGSLVRPERLLRAMHAQEQAAGPLKDISRLQDECIRDVAALQERVGLRLITDGEFRRRSWQRGFMDAVGGFTIKPGAYTFRNAAGVTNPGPGFFANHKLVRRKGIATQEFSFLRAITKRTPKITLPSPTIFHFGLFKESASREAYPDIDAFFDDLVAIYHQEIDELAKLGCTHIQLDEVPLALMCDESNREIAKQQGEDPDCLIDRYVELNNAVLARRPNGMRFGIHLCRGNQAGLWAGSGGYEPISARLFNAIKVDEYLLEYDSERAGGFEPLRDLPAGKRAFIGVVSTKEPRLEQEDELKRRIEAAMHFAPIERLGLCPQCGFASSISTWNKTKNPMNEVIQEQKLALLIRAAQSIWG
jgi:5-methyltetrahydropteroyltriglutamate--homocysteine methyltransferase